MFLPLTPDGIQAFYNWAIAISDRAKMRGRTKEAEELWKQVNKLLLPSVMILCILNSRETDIAFDSSFYYSV